MLEKLKKLLKLPETNSKGFTIIEVMIVLAVAALIILIVLLAVPALQRSSRNTTIKNDASSVEGGITSYENNNNGTLPSYVSNGGSTNGTVTIGSSSTDSNSTTAKVQGSTVVCMGSAPGSVNSSVTPDTPAQSSGSCTNTLGSGQVIVVKGSTCDGTANDRDMALYYGSEQGGGKLEIECIDT